MEMIYTDIKGKKVMKVRVFNHIKRDKWRKDVEAWRRFGNGGMPFLPMYIFTKENGEAYKRGYVVSDGDSHKFYHTKEEVFVNEGIRVHI